MIKKSPAMLALDALYKVNPEDLTEVEIQAEVLVALRSHPAVAFVHRQNSGVFRASARTIKAGFPGCPDIIGMLKGGRYLAVEVKKRGCKPSQEQSTFLDKVAESGGAAFVAHSAAEAVEWIETLKAEDF